MNLAIAMPFIVGERLLKDWVLVSGRAGHGC